MLQKGLSVGVSQPDSLSERSINAQHLIDITGVTTPVYLDGMDGTLMSLFRALPERLVVISRDGEVLFIGGEGPFDYSVAELEEWMTTGVKMTMKKSRKLPAIASAVVVGIACLMLLK
eukprot:gnl/Dysnectes_brevis/2578_a3107_1635.p1 GENE.gnl/Dysnectes_brevis/2578_a3107_1635~~gnl/Dysnectes_brevis/2578_a3107_1635.p1  ORF type:complete len:118 (+),score=15.23 gnl/Dysnectes_brevis/2578_a3107_1635:361-714(+)